MAYTTCGTIGFIYLSTRVERLSRVSHSHCGPIFDVWLWVFQVNIDGRAVVVACFVQRSTVLSRSRGKMFDKGEEVDPLYTPADQFWGVHVSSCGHMMHSDCWQGFYSSVVARERRALRLRQFISVDIARREFLCPLCGCISNTVLPVMPSLLNGQGKQ